MFVRKLGRFWWKGGWLSKASSIYGKKRWESLKWYGNLLAFLIVDYMTGVFEFNGTKVERRWNAFSGKAAPKTAGVPQSEVYEDDSTSHLRPCFNLNSIGVHMRRSWQIWSNIQVLKVESCHVVVCSLSCHLPNLMKIVMSWWHSLNQRLLKVWYSLRGWRNEGDDEIIFNRLKYLTLQNNFVFNWSLIN